MVYSRHYNWNDRKSEITKKCNSVKVRKFESEKVRNCESEKSVKVKKFESEKQGL